MNAKINRLSICMSTCQAIWISVSRAQASHYNTNTILQTLKQHYYVLFIQNPNSFCRPDVHFPTFNSTCRRVTFRPWKSSSSLVFSCVCSTRTCSFGSPRANGPFSVMPLNQSLNLQASLSTSQHAFVRLPPTCNSNSQNMTNGHLVAQLRSLSS